jgi:hypothetical protein
MSLRSIFVKKLIFALILLYFSIHAIGIQDYSLPEVLKVLNAIEKMERERSDGNKGPLKKIVITENELNSYVAYWIETNDEKIMKELRLKLFRGNKIEGKVMIDLEGQSIPKFLRPQMDLYFRGKIEVKNSQVRLVLKDLFLEEQRIEPKILDFIIALAAKIENYKVWSINDWFELRYGIREIKTQNHKAIFFY